MNNNILDQNTDVMADGVKNLIADFRVNHPHESNMIIWAGVALVSVFGFFNEYAALKKVC